MTIHVEPTDLVGVEHRTLAFTRYDGTAAIDVPGELLTVTQDPTAPHLWCAWYTCAYHTTATAVLATHVVDGSSVCAGHLPAQVERARAARRRIVFRRRRSGNRAQGQP